MPYHQTAIRDLELPAAGQVGRGLMTLSEGSRSFTRYGYADLLGDDRRYTVRHRIFAGTQRLLLSGDPAATSTYSRMFQFCGSTGVDLMEPLTCRGRRGTGIAGTRRSGYADEALEPRWDWEKFEFWYRVWGRFTYNPDTGPEPCARPFDRDTAQRAITALAAASRILPIVTTAHLPSAACDAYWPEVYWNQPMTGEPRPNPYGDTPAPKTFQYVSPLDPQIFSSINEHADELLKKEWTGKYSPIEVAQWIEDLAAQAERALATTARPTAAERRLTIDVQMLVDLGRFFAAKFRAGVLYTIHERTQDRRALDEALTKYREARRSWASVAERARVYAADVSASDKISERGQWADRLPAIDEDIDRMMQRTASASTAPSDSSSAAIAYVLRRPMRPSAPCTHTPPAGFTPGAPLSLTLNVSGGRAMTTVQCFYRHVNQAERFQRIDMTRDGATYRATIPATYTDSSYSLQYYFILKEDAVAHLHPGLGQDLLNQPYVVLGRLH
jgi:hypothetical protein